MLVIQVGLRDEIFEHVDEKGVHRFFNTTKLYPYAVQHGEPILTWTEPSAQHVLKCGGVEEAKIARLCEPYLSEPTLGVLWPDGTTVVVDGNHRIVRLWRDGVVDFKMYRVKTLAECEPFLVKGIPDGFIVGM